MIINFGRVRSATLGLLAVAVLAASGAAAQSSSQLTVTVPYASDSTADGYVNAAVNVTYAFIACQGEMHIAYHLNADSATIGPLYRMGGTTYPSKAEPPRPTSIRFAGTVYRGPAAVGSFQDVQAGPALGMGCFSGQTQKFANIADRVGPKPTADQVTAYLDSLRVEVRPAEVLRSVSEESMIRGELRRVEAEVAAAKRKAEQEELAKARQQEAELQAAAEQQAEADRMAAAQAAQTEQTAQAGADPLLATPASAGFDGGIGTGESVQASSAPLSDSERIAQAIASDQILADQRLEEERNQLAAQQQALVEQEQQMNQALITAAPALLDAAGGIYGAIEAFDTRWKTRSYEAAQAKLAGQCILPDGLVAPKDGDIQLGVELKAKLRKSDCGYSPVNRYKAFKLELPQRMQLQFTIKPAIITTFTSFQIEVLDLDDTSHMFLGWQDWGVLQKVNYKTADLPAGVYIVRVSNGVQDIFASFKLRVDVIGQAEPVSAELQGQ